MRRTLALTLAASLALGGCLQSPTTPCGDLLCAASFACAPNGHECVLHEQLEVCADKAPETPCVFAAGEGHCREGICKPPTCGDGIFEAPEECDGAALADKDCTNFGFDLPGGLACGDDCRIDLTGCSGTCNDLVKNADESCDSDDLDGKTCRDFGFYEDVGLACTGICTFDVAGCRVAGSCGDGTINGPETCDGTQPPITACSEAGYDFGEITCGACQADVSDCGRVGFLPFFSPVTDDLLAVWGTGHGDVWAVGAGGAIVRFDGVAWKREASPVTMTVRAISGTTNTNVWAVGVDSGGAGHVIRSDGTVWTEVVVGSPLPALNGVWVSGTTVVVVGANGTIARHDGTSWTVAAVGTATLNAVWGTDPTSIVAVGDGGTILESTGGAFAAGVSGTVEALRDVRGVGTEVWAVGSNGVLARRGIGGWAATTSTRGDQRGFAVLPEGDTFVVSNGGLLSPPNPFAAQVVDGNAAYFFDGARTMKFRPTAATTYVNALWTDARGSVFAVGRAGQLWRYHGAFTEVYDRQTTQGSSVIVGGVVWGTAINDLYFSNYASTDGTYPNYTQSWKNWHYDGDVFTLIGASTTTNTPLAITRVPPDEVIAVGTGGRIFNFKTASTTTVAGSPTLRGIASLEPGAAIAVGDGATIVRKTGSSWAPMSPGLTGDLYAVWASGSNDIWVGGEAGNLQHFDGSAWTAFAVTPAITADVVSIAGRSATDVYAIAGRQVLHFDGATWTAEPIDDDLMRVVIAGNAVILGGRELHERDESGGPWRLIRAALGTLQFGLPTALIGTTYYSPPLLGCGVGLCGATVTTVVNPDGW